MLVSAGSGPALFENSNNNRYLYYYNMNNELMLALLTKSLTDISCMQGLAPRYTNDITGCSGWGNLA